MKLKDIKIDGINNIFRCFGIKDENKIIKYLKKYCGDLYEYEVLIKFNRFNTYENVVEYEIIDSRKYIILKLG